MNSFSFKVFGCFVLLFVFFAVDLVHAGYQKVAPGDTVTLGEFVFTDDFVPTMTPCTIGITDPLNVVVVASTTPMLANADGWHYYNYAIAVDAASGTWPSVMICGSAIDGDLIKADKSFIVDPSVFSLGGTVEADISAIKAKTDTINWADITAILTDTGTIDWTDVDGIVTTAGAIKTKTDTIDWTDVDSILIDTGAIAWADVTGIKTKTDTISWVDVTGIKAKTDTINWADITAIPLNVWTYSTRGLTTFGTLVSDTATAVWATGTRTLTGFGTLAADVWTNTTRTLTGASLDSGSLATLSDIDAATSTLIAEIQGGWTVTLSDFGETTVNTAYKAKLQVLNHATVPTDADSLPAVVITDSVGTVQVPAGVMTKDSAGTYSFSYSIGGSAVGGVWETVVSVVINGETVRVNDYWSLSSSPADIQILEITDKVIPTITASVRIDNMGTSASDFYYVYCIVSSADNLCGGDDDIDSASATVFINAGSFVNLSLTLDDVTTAGTYWFKVKTRALAETNWAAATEQFIAESGTIIPPPDGGGGGGGGGDGAVPPPPTYPTTPQFPETGPTACNGADFNGDGRVNSIDFSILLAFWQTQPPFDNPCVDINKDGKVNSVDFSILLYQWNR